MVYSNNYVKAVEYQNCIPNYVLGKDKSEFVMINLQAYDQLGNVPPIKFYRETIG